MFHGGVYFFKIFVSSTICIVTQRRRSAGRPEGSTEFCLAKTDIVTRLSAGRPRNCGWISGRGQEMLVFWSSRPGWRLSSSNLSQPLFYFLYRCARLQASAAKWIRTALFLVVHAARDGNLLPTFRDNLLVSFSEFEMALIGCTETTVTHYHYSLHPEDGTDRLPRNVSNELPLLAA